MLVFQYDLRRKTVDDHLLRREAHPTSVHSRATEGPGERRTHDHSPGGCAESSGSKDEFCAKLPRTTDVLELISGFDTADPNRLEERAEEGIDRFRELERAAPRELRPDVAEVADAAKRILAAVKENPDDPAAVRVDLAGDSQALISAGRSALRVVAYANDECGIDLSTTSTPRPSPGGGG
jgi:hypothetical protein